MGNSGSANVLCKKDGSWVSFVSVQKRIQWLGKIGEEAWKLSVADPEFPRGEHQPSRGGAKLDCYLATFLPKTAWKCKKLDRYCASIPLSPTHISENGKKNCCHRRTCKFPFYWVSRSATSAHLKSGTRIFRISEVGSFVIIKWSHRDRCVVCAVHIYLYEWSSHCFSYNVL